MAMDIVAILSVCVSGMVSIISTIQNSRCDQINCWGIRCHRKLKDDIINNEVVTDIVSPRQSQT